MNKIEQIVEIVKTTWKVADRIAKLEALGHTVQIKAMGAGGRLRKVKVGTEERLQISAGWGKFNYAYVVIL